MKRIFAFIFPAVVVLVAQAGMADTAQGRLVTQGEAAVQVVPDAAHVSVGVVREAPEAAQALAAASDGMRRAIALFAQMGVAERDMQTSNLSVGPVWSGRGPDPAEAPRITGFVARNTLTLAVRDLSVLGGLLDAAISDGANSFDGLRFVISEPAPFEAEARRAAVADAMAQASDIAAAAGVELGDIMLIDATSQTGGRPMMEMASARMAADVPVAAGELSVSARVTMTFAIAP